MLLAKGAWSMDKIRDIVSKMTFEEKAMLTSGISTMGVSGTLFWHCPCINLVFYQQSHSFIFNQRNHRNIGFTKFIIGKGMFDADSFS